MGRTGSCLDNAVAESWFASLKVELVHRAHYRTRAEARAAIFAWIAWYNRCRLHSHQRLPATHRVGTPARHHQPATIDHGRIAPVSTSRGEVQDDLIVVVRLLQHPGLPGLRRPNRWLPAGAAGQQANLIRVLKATVKGPQRGSQHPAYQRPPTTKDIRRQRQRPDFRPGTGAAAGRHQGLSGTFAGCIPAARALGGQVIGDMSVTVVVRPMPGLSA